MTTDFNYNNKTIDSGGPIKPSGTDQPGDPRTRVDFYSDIKLIPNPYVGMIITVKTDETNQNKMTDYKVLSLKANTLGIANSVIDRVQRYVDYLGVSSSGGGTSAGTGTGLTSEQAQRLTTAYEHSQSPHINTTDVNNAVSTYVTAHKAELKGDKGDTGADGTTPTLTVGSVTTLAAGSNATVTISENSNVYTLNFGIPKGANGDVGTGSTDNAFKNKVANFLGDSQTEANVFKTKPYYDWVKEILGLSKVNNYGVSGSTIAKNNASDNRAMCVRYANMDNNADLICVMGGVNDRWHNSQMGSFGSVDPTTFYGAMETMCDGLLTKYPGKTIIFITPTEQNNDGCNSTNRTGYTVADFANAMKKVCAKYSIPVFDANTCSGIYPINETNATLYTADKLHLNNKGHEVIGVKLSKFILNGANVVVINNSSGGESGGGSTSDTYGNIVVSKTTATINEGGSDTFTVKLDKAPTNPQTVNISSNNSDVTLSTNTLTFTPNNYNQTQEVRINVAEDSDATNDSCTLTLSSNNVPSKTITITVTDNDTSSETPPETPGENQFIGKTVTVTRNYGGGAYAHLTALLNVDEDMRSNSTYNITLNGSNVHNINNASNTGGSLFGDNSGEVANGSFTGTVSGKSTFTQTVSDGNLTITATPRTGAATTNYVKVPILLSGTVPYSFQIDEIKVIVNNVERNILKLGAFFASDQETITIE